MHIRLPWVKYHLKLLHSIQTAQLFSAISISFCLENSCWPKNVSVSLHIWIVRLENYIFDVLDSWIDSLGVSCCKYLPLYFHFSLFRIRTIIFFNLLSDDVFIIDLANFFYFWMLAHTHIQRHMHLRAYKLCDMLNHPNFYHSHHFFCVVLLWWHSVRFHLFHSFMRSFSIRFYLLLFLLHFFHAAV